MRLFRQFALLLVSVSIAAAQAPPPPNIPAPPSARVPGPPASVPAAAAPIPVAVPGAPAGAPTATPERKPSREAAVRDPNVPLGETKIVEPIEEVTLKGAELAILYRKYTGRRVIVAAAAATTEFSFVQDASPQDPLTYAQAAELLKKAAGIENFVFIADEKDPNLDILTVATRPPGIGYDVYNENSVLPEGEAVITYVMTFKHLKPETAAQAFTQIIGSFGTYGSIAPLNGSVVITENTSLIRRLIKLKEEIDKPADITGTRFILVKYADVTELAGTLNELLNTQQQAQKTAAVQRAAAPAAPAVPGMPVQPGVVTSAGAATSTDTPVQIIPEPRTNRVFAMGRPVDLLFVEGLIREFDIETSEKTFLRRKLKFLTVSDFLPIAEDALNRAFTSTGDGGSTAGAAGGAAGGAARSNTRSNSNSRSGSSNRSSAGSAGSNSSFGGGNSSFGSSGSGSSSGGAGGGGGGGASSSLGSPNASTAPESRLVGRTLLVADNITNSVIVQGPPSGLEIVQRLLDQVDVKADQVMISSVIGQLTLTDDKELGLDYLYNGINYKGRGGAGIGPILPIDPIPALTPGGATTDFNRGSLTGGGLRVYGKINDLNIYLRALQEKSNFTVLSRPSIFTANNQKGVISSGQRIAIPTNSNSFNNGGASTNIQYQDVVLKLEVIPLINSDKEITLQIALLDDEVNGTQTIQGAGANGSDLTVPKISTREILTTVTVPNNETIVLGGLITATKSEAVTGIPILSSIPYLGKLFGGTSKKDDRAELLVFLQPSIIRTRNSLDAVQADMDQRYKGSSDVRNFADGPGGLPAPDASPVTDKNGTPPKALPVEPPVPSKMKKSIRPAYRQ